MKKLRFFLKMLIIICAPITYAEIPILKGEWDNKGYISGVNLKEFNLEEKSLPAIILTFKDEKNQISIFMSDISAKYSDRKFRINLTILLPKCSLAFHRTPSGSVSRDIFMGNGFIFPTNEKELTDEFLKIIFDDLANSLARNLPGFFWKNKSEALAGLAKMTRESKFYLAQVLKLRKKENKHQGGIIEFEVLTDIDKNIVGSRITEELVID